LNNFLQKSREKNSVVPKYANKFGKENEIIPNDEHQVFVAGYDYQTIPENEFRIFLTTKKLMSFTTHVI
jgi:hypothetical protein